MSVFNTDYSRVSLYEVEICLRCLEDDVKYRHQTYEQSMATWCALQLIAIDLIDPQLMHRTDAKLYYPTINDIIQNIYDMLKEIVVNKSVDLHKEKENTVSPIPEIKPVFRPTC